MENTIYIPIEYHLESYHRSNQDTCLVHRPTINEGNWVQPGDILADCSSSKNGELAIGQNILIAYMPWEGYNYEDAMLISDRLVYDEIYTSIHIERYDISIEDTQFGFEKITKEISDLPGENLSHLDKNGIAMLGSWVKEGDILVGKVTPTDKKVKYSNYEKLLYDILGTKKQNKGKDTSLRVPKGLEAKVINIEILSDNLSFSLTNYNLVSLPNPLIYIQNGFLKFLSIQNKKNINSPNYLIEDRFKKKFLKISSITWINFQKFIQQTIIGELSTKSQIPIVSSSIKDLATLLNSIKFILLPRSYYPLFGILINSNYKSFTLSNLLNNKKQVKKKKKKMEQNMEGFKSSKKPQITKYKYRLSEKEKLTLFENFLFQILILAKNKQHFFLIKKLLNSASRYTRYSQSFLVSNTVFTNSNKLYRKKNTLEFTERSKNQTNIKIKFQKLRTNKNKKVYSIKNNEVEQNCLPRKKDFSLNLLNYKPFTINVYLAEKRKIQVGDKIAGRHGNKGIVSKILPIQDMPYLADGSAVDLVLNPLGVPSRMNVGQIYECLLGLAGYYLGEYYRTLPFDEKIGEEASRSFVFSKLYEAGLKTANYWLFDPKNPGKTYLFDGRTGEKFEQQVTVGYAYILKLVHLVDDKIHCLTGDHDVLTNNGWKNISRLLFTDKIATLENTFLIYQSPKDLLFYPNYSGKIYQLSTYYIDLNVTINHRMWISDYNPYYKNWSDFKLREVFLLSGKIIQYKKTAKWIHKNYKFISSKININSIIFIESLKKINKKILNFLIIEFPISLSSKSKKFKINEIDFKLMFFRQSSLWRLFLWILKNFWQRVFSMDVFLMFFAIWINNFLILKNQMLTNYSQLYLAPPCSLQHPNDLNWKVSTFTNKKYLPHTYTHTINSVVTILNKNSLNFLFEYQKIQTNIDNMIKSKKTLKFFCTKIQYLLQNKKNKLIHIQLYQGQTQKDNLNKFYYLIKILIKFLIYEISKKNNQINHLQQNYQNNFFPFWLWLLNKRQCRIYLNAILFSSFFEIQKKFYYLILNSSLADELIRIILHAGWNSNLLRIPNFLLIEINKLFRKKNVNTYNSISNQILFKKNSQNCKIKKQLQHIQLYQYNNKISFNLNENVYCLKIPSEIFFVRRNGKMVWTGNSRSTGPYSAVTQQPLRGRSKQGGQRLGEMEVWALEGYGAAFTLLELLTIKSDDKIGRLTIWDSILRQKEISIKTPESFKVLVCELKALCFDIGIFRKNK
uniref:DNA-directed RNA polymerase n=1 Tax=Oedocladium prescottii TaxID=337949 RepID=A0A8K1N1D2_9CHLO|nr:beta subunit of RNA polymerase [Oedocladium prescottii]